MVAFSVCLETVFTDLPVEERIRRIKEAGFTSVEFWHPEATWDGKSLRKDLAKDASAVRQACEDSGVKLAGFALHAWDGSFGGCPVKPRDRELYLDQIRRMLALFGHEVVRLRRVRFGPLDIGSLNVGKWRALAPEEVGALRREVGIAGAGRMDFAP